MDTENTSFNGQCYVYKDILLHVALIRSIKSPGYLSQEETTLLGHYKGWLGGTGLLFLTLIGTPIYNIRKKR